ncbi:unnamed protein product [Paramecium pentaurelia]|uniref:Uncharacterized protein n=1 Tax=Paramecium pentaurelia TaxID=43138 RepID=A0A8S1SCD3_9CILI|nr:unnamed protein product [Paramecium pentaurelia]
MSAVELPDIRLYSNKSNTRQSKKSDYEKYRKLAVIKSVDKLIKKNDLQSVLGFDDDYYPKQIEDQKKVNEAHEVHINLTELKKSCDSMKINGIKKEKDIENMRKEIDSMTIQVDQYNQTQNNLQVKEKELQQKLENQHKLLSESQYDRKIFEHMLNRMKKDQLVYQLRANQYERHLQLALQQHHSSTYKTQQIQEIYSKTLMALKEVTEGIQQQNKNREKNLQRFKDDLKQRQDIEQKRDDRIKRQQEIAEVAAKDIKDSALKKWRKLLLVHKFLNSFLKNKMQRGIAQYQDLEMTFQKIKASTGITDANDIVQKFLGREQTYAHLLISISDYEKKINALKNENQELLTQFSSLKQQYTDMDKEFQVETYRQKEDQFEQDKLVQEVEEKATVAGLLENKLRNWMSRGLKKLGLQKNLGFQAIIDAIREKLLNLSVKQQEDLLNQSILNAVSDIKDQEFLKRNVRVKPKKQLTQSHTNHSMDQSSIKDDEDMFDELPIKEDEEDELEEEKLIEQLREEIKVKNHKK